MSDEALRALERAYLESRSPADEASWLTARERSGKLSRVHLELAAFCGHPAARLALGGAAPREEPDIRRWCAALERYGPEASVRAAHAAALSVVRLWDERPDPAVAYLGEACPGEQLAAVAEWIECPCEYHVEEALRTLPVSGGGIASEHGDHAWTLAHDAAGDAVLTIRRPSFVWNTLLNAALARGRALVDPSLVDRAHAMVREVASTALVAWALA
jgi:hypothetical protein